MYNQSVISPEEHESWFIKASKDPLRHLLIFISDDKPIGYVNITEDIKGKVANWGFYVAPGSLKGTGKRLGKTAMNFAFGSLGLHKVCGQVIAFNQQSIRFHLDLGFTLEGTLRDQFFDGQDFHNVNHFGLLQKEWNFISYKDS